jgi:hypothetical protein
MPPLPRLLAVFALYAIPVFLTVQPVGHPIVDPDVWWHLRVGQWVVDHRALPDADPFTQEARPWVAYSWLYEVLLYGLYAAFGLHGIIAYRVVMSLLVVWATHALVCRLTRHFLASTGLTLAAVLALQPLLYERPWLFTILFTTLTLRAVLELRLAATRPAPRWVWAVPLLFVMWANIHIQFVYGLVVLGLGCVAPLIDRALQLPGPADDSATTAFSPRWYQLLYLSAICLVATLVSPYHVGIYGVMVEYARYTGAFRTVAELLAPEFREPASYLLLALTLAAAFTLGRRSAGSFEVLLLAGTAFLAFRARRDLWFAVLAALVILATAAPREDEAGAADTPPALRAVGLALLVALAFLVGRARGLSPEALERTAARHFPVAAVRAIKDRGYSGPLFNDFNWGGYLIWALPEMPVAIDGRTNLHGDERMARFGRTWAGLPGWQDDPDLSAAGVILTPLESPLASLLLLDRRFREAYRDKIARVFVRRGGEG